jgi:hypothetical protein
VVVGRVARELVAAAAGRVARELAVVVGGVAAAARWRLLGEQVEAAER